MLLHVEAGSLQLERGGYCLFADAAWTNYQHRHPEFQEICWVVRGTGEFRHGKSVHGLKRGDCFISEPNIIHEICSPERQDLELFFMTFQMKPLTGVVDAEADRVWQAYQQEHQLIANVTDAEHFWRILRGASSLREQYIMRSLFLESLHTLSGSAIKQEIAQDDPATLAMAYIRRHAKEAPSVLAIAQAAGLSERQLRRRFQECYQCGIIDAINQVRLDEARRLLLMQHSVSAAAQAVGIASPAMFSRLFKKAYGQTPSQWRKQQIPSKHVTNTVFGD